MHQLCAFGDFVIVGRSSSMVPRFSRLHADHHTLVHFTVNGLVCSAPEGEPLATSLLASGHLTLRHSPNQGTARGSLCLMGVCQECAIHVDGEIKQACMTPVTAGMVVELRGVV